jgi:hypothetical protein
VGTGVVIGEIGRDDLAQLAAFLAGENAGATDGVSALNLAQRARQLEWFLFENPAQPDAVPRGWLARDAEGRVVGSKLCVGQRFVCDGQPHTLLMGGGYYVSSAHRGLGLALMGRYLEQGKRHALYASTMNEVSGGLYEHYGGYPIPRTDHEWLGILRPAPVVEEWLVRRFGRPGLARFLSRAAALRPAGLGSRRAPPGELRPVAEADLADLAIETPPEHAREITASRDPDFLRWRYFQGDDPSRRIYVYRSERGERALVAVNRRARGHRGQVQALMVLDYWGRIAGGEIVYVARHLAARHRDEADLIVFRGQPDDRARCLREAGFLRRLLPRAIGVCIDRHGLLPTRDWYLVPADGDMGH